MLLTLTVKDINEFKLLESILFKQEYLRNNDIEIMVVIESTKDKYLYALEQIPNTYAYTYVQYS